MSVSTIISFIIAAILVIVIAKVLFKSTKSIVGILINTLVGAVILWVLNLLGLGITINWLTAAIVGLLGIPGVIIVLILKFIFHI